MKSYRFSIVLFLIIILLLILDISLFAQNNPRNDLIPVPEKPLKPGWKRILIHNVGRIDIPPTMEIQKGKYVQVTEDALKKKKYEKEYKEYKRFKKYLRDRDIVIQQKGLNDLDPNAFKLYVRVIVMTIILKPGEAEPLSSELSLSENELKEFSEMAKLEAQKLKFTKILQWNPPLIKDVNGMKTIYISYRRQVKKNPPVFVQTYTFQNYDRIHQLILSYRENEKHLWQKDLNDIFSSFVITNIRKGKGEPKIKDAMSIAMSILFGENWPLGLIISAILTWGIGLAPPLLIRFVFLKRSLKKMNSIIVVVFFWFLNLIIFTALGSRSKTHMALVLVAFVSYYILRAGSKRNQKMDSTANYVAFKPPLLKRFTSLIEKSHGGLRMREETSKRKAYLHLRELISKDEVLLLVHKKYRGIRKLLIYSLCGISLKYFDKAYKTGKVAIEIGENGPRIRTPIPWQKALSESVRNFSGEEKRDF